MTFPERTEKEKEPVLRGKKNEQQLMNCFNSRALKTENDVSIEFIQ
jgi:hypothetical protein